MRKGSREFYDLMNQFEKDLQNTPTSLRFDRESGNVPNGVYYEDGSTNLAFQAYMFGYQSAKCLARIGLLPLDE